MRYVLDGRVIVLFVLGIIFTISRETWANQICLPETSTPSTTPTHQFIDHGNGTVTDSRTGLMWAKCVDGLQGNDCMMGNPVYHTWENALSTAMDNRLGDYSDWRVPNIVELRSIVEHGCYSPAINLTVFPNTPVSNYWSSTPDTRNISNAWRVTLSSGYVSNFTPRDGNMYVRFVRTP